jgi:hypothetical protein
LDPYWGTYVSREYGIRAPSNLRHHGYDVKSANEFDHSQQFHYGIESGNQYVGCSPDLHEPANFSNNTNDSKSSTQQKLRGQSISCTVD